MCWLGLGWGEARNRVAEIAENAKPLANGNINQYYAPDNYQGHSSAGTSADYLTARIARDNPAILEGMFPKVDDGVTILSVALSIFARNVGQEKL